MPCNVNDVYVSVTRLANKNQQGYISITDFNKFAELANVALFQKYYGSPNRYQPSNPLPPINYAQNQYISEALAPFMVYDDPLTLTSGSGTVPSNLIHLVNVNSLNGSNRVAVRRVEHDRLYSWINSSIDSPTSEFPIFVETNNSFKFYPNTITGVQLTYLRMPNTPVWGYTVNGQGRPVYDAGTSTDFEWSKDEFYTLVMMILSMAGISIKDGDLVGYGENGGNK